MVGTAKSSFLGQAPKFSGTTTLISSATASNSAEIEFTIPNTDYDQLEFSFYNIQPVTDDVNFQMHLKPEGGTYSTFGVDQPWGWARHNEADSEAVVESNNAGKTQGSAPAKLFIDLGNGTDESLSGHLILLNPRKSPNKHYFFSVCNGYEFDDGTQWGRSTGEFYEHSSWIPISENPLTGVKFSMSSGNINAGTIKMWGMR